MLERISTEATYYRGENDFDEYLDVPVEDMEFTLRVEFNCELDTAVCYFLNTVCYRGTFGAPPTRPPGGIP